MAQQYIITAEKDGIAVNRDYALGDYASTIFDSEAEAQEIAARLQADVGDVVEAGIEYSVEEYN